MEVTLFYSVVILALYFVGRGFFSLGPGYFTLPTLFAIVILLWVVPQLWSIRIRFPYFDQPLFTIYLMTILAMFGTAVGWSQGKAHGRRRNFRMPNRQLLFGTAIVLTAIAGITTLLIRYQGVGIGGAQTGIVTILLFFNNLKIVALFLSIYLALRHRSRASLVLVAINLLIYAPLILLFFRRRAMVELAVCIILGLWFARGFLVPRIVVLSVLLAAFPLVFAVGALRTLAMGDIGWSYLSLADLRTIDFFALTPFADSSRAPELLNAVNLVQLADLHGLHTLGTETWNRFIHQWIPAQIVGADVKIALMFQGTISDNLYTRFNYLIPTGSTNTGIGEAYLEFGYFGALFFTFTAYFMGRWWAQAHRGDPWAMAFFVAGMTPALISITNYASYFYDMMLLFLIMIWMIRGVLSKFIQSWSRPSHSRSAQMPGAIDRAAPR